MKLLRRVQQELADELERAALLPAWASLTFDPAEEGGDDGAAATPTGPVQKTRRRRVVSLDHGRFQAREVVRQSQQSTDRPVHRSAGLSSLVPRGGRYAYDLIARVGVATLVQGRSLQEVGAELASRHPAIPVPASTLWELQPKFLFYLGALHQQAAPALRRRLEEEGNVLWLLDGTVEPGSDVFLGILHAQTNIMLSSWKIRSENLDEISQCLQQTAERYGRPARVLHDLSASMTGACEQAFDGQVSHGVCHYHLARDIGEDLYRQPQAALSGRLTALKLQLRMRDQRRRQADWLRQHLDSPADLVLADLLAGRPVAIAWNESLGREVLLAMHHWILDYPSDGRRRGFPFDPYLLYLHRRLVRAGESLDRLLRSAKVARQAPRSLLHFQQQLRDYRHDPGILEAADRYERAAAIFDRLREALRLSAPVMDGLRQPHQLPTDEQSTVVSSLAQLRHQLRCQSENEADRDRAPARMVLVHLDKYWDRLQPPPMASGADGPWERTTNKLESQWGGRKRVRRRSHGRPKLTRDFEALPEEYMLTGNLQQPLYLEIALQGSLESLPDKLAEAGQHAGSYSSWRQRRRPRIHGKPPRRLLRNPNFVDQLVRVCTDHYATTPQVA